MKKVKTILLAFLALALLNVAFAHEDDFGEAGNSFHLLHMGKLTFPVWTYWAEIIEHFAIVATVLIGLILAYTSLKLDKRYILFTSGFIILVISETFTLFHHFLIFPFGVFNAVFHHGLLFVGILLLVCGFVKLIRESKQK